MDEKSQDISLSKKQNHIVISETTFDENGFGSSTKRGIVPISPDRDPDEMLELALDRKWKLGAEADVNGFYPVLQVAAGTAVETEK